MSLIENLKKVQLQVPERPRARKVAKGGVSKESGARIQESGGSGVEQVVRAGRGPTRLLLAPGFWLLASLKLLELLELLELLQN
jgi:hypothetical protein